jgi:hypothetical protein
MRPPLLRAQTPRVVLVLTVRQIDLHRRCRVAKPLVLVCLFGGFVGRLVEFAGEVDAETELVEDGEVNGEGGEVGGCERWQKI